MNSWERSLEIALLVQLMTFALHDTVPLGRWNNLRRFRAEIPLQRRVTGSLANSVTALATVGMFYMGWLRGGKGDSDWQMALVITLGILVYMEFRAWWQPYLFGASPEIVAKLLPNWERTYAFLPVRNGIQPNAMHCLMHASTVVAFVCALVDHHRLMGR